MGLKHFVILAVWALWATTLHAQVKFWGIRASIPSSVGTLGGNKFNTDGYKARATFAIAATFSKIHTGEVGWTGYSIGLGYRKFDLQGTTSSTNLQIQWVEVPVEFHATGNFFRILPLGFHIGGFIATPFQCKGSIYRYNQANYDFGNQQYEKPYAIVGFKGGLNLSLALKKKYIFTFFGSYNLSFLRVAKSAPEGVTPEFDIPLPTFFEWGVSFMLGKNQLDKP